MQQERKHFSIESLIEDAAKEFKKIADPCKRKSNYPIDSCLLSGLGMFYLKMSSLLQFVEEVKSDTLTKNLIKLFNIPKIPSDTHFRVRLDDIEYSKLQYVFDRLISKLQHGKVLE